ncbi:MAG: hypothetical protein V3V78_00080 [Candidatus Woesearchaeota archaeon]
MSKQQGLYVLAKLLVTIAGFIILTGGILFSGALEMGKMFVTSDSNETLPYPLSYSKSDAFWDVWGSIIMMAFGCAVGISSFFVWFYAYKRYE